MYVSGKSRNKDLEEVDAVLCQPCQERNQSTCSNGFCAQCREHMCVTCFETHKQFKVNRGHSLADGNDASETVEQNEVLQKCDQHFNELVKFYCHEHEQVGCGDCMILEHKVCNVEDIRDKARKFADSLEFKGLVNDADKCLSQCKETATSIKNNKVQVSDISEKFIKDVEMFSESLISQINKMKNSMIKQANMVRSKDLETLEELERENEVLMEDISSLAELLKSQIEQPCKLFVSYVIKKTRLKQLEETHSKIEKQNSLKNYQFNQNCNLEQAVKETNALGSLQEIKIENDEADNGSESDEDEERRLMERRKQSMERQIQGPGRRGKSGKFRRISKFFGFGKKKSQKESLLLPKPLLSDASGSEYVPEKQTEADKETSYTKLKSTVHGWRDCLQMTDKASQLNTARGLLERNILPDQAQVRLASSVFGRCSETFLNICSSISEYIKSKSDDFIDVWAAYRYYEHIKDDDIKPVFVVITKKGKAGVNENDFDVIERDESVFSPESEKVLVEVENDLSGVNIFPDSKLTDIENCVSLNADSLIDKHRNLNIVSPSVKKSKNFGKSDAQISDELCIVLFVHIKGLIPIAEEPFPSKIGEFRTDVLEGGFKLFHGGPYDYHEQLKMGLAIHANVTDNNGDRLYGTLGGFLDYQHVGMCALTCAHVVLTTHEMQQLVTRNTLSSKEIDKEVFQSVLGFGKVVLAVYRTGDERSSGIDFALIQITQRHPKDGSFPAASNYADAGFDECNPMVYKKGKVSPLNGIRRRAEVYKYGIGTEVTRGSLYLRGAFVKTSEMSANDQPFEYRLHNQITVLSPGDARFADHGDSGALVFFDDTDDDSVAIGIVEGGHTNNRIVYVTPLCEILDNIGADVSMTKFTNDGSVSYDSGLDMDTS